MCREGGREYDGILLDRCYYYCFPFDTTDDEHTSIILNHVSQRIHGNAQNTHTSRVYDTRQYGSVINTIYKCIIIAFLVR